jgi:hypothetical protein
MPDSHFIDPSNQQGQPQNSSGAVSPANKATGGKQVRPNDRLEEGPEGIPDHRDTLRRTGDRPVPLPNHPGATLKPEPGIPMPDTSREPAGRKIGKETH